MRVLHAPVNLANQPWTLSRAERELGLDSTLIIDHASNLNYSADLCLGQKSDPLWRIALRQLRYGLQTPWQYDVLHYYAGASFLGDPFGPRRHGKFLDLKLAKLLGRRVVMTLQGCDVRQSDEHDRRNAVTMCREKQCNLAAECRRRRDPLRRRFIEQVLPWCDRVFVLNPDLLNDVPRAEFMPYGSVDVAAIRPVPPRTEGPITLLHAPTDESIKGTRYVLAAVEALQKRWPVRLLLVRGVSHAEAMRMYEAADLVVDQLFAGWYGGLAVETMALGKPTASYIREADLPGIPDAMRRELPVANLRVASLEQDLEALLERRHEWPDWGRRCREYVLRWHHPRRIAEALERVYRDAAAPFELRLDATARVARDAAAPHPPAGVAA